MHACRALLVGVAAGGRLPFWRESGAPAQPFFNSHPPALQHLSVGSAMSDPSSPWSGAAAAIAARRQREQMDELLARQMQAQCDNEAAAAAAARGEDGEGPDSSGSSSGCSASPPVTRMGHTVAAAATASAPASSSSSSSDAARALRESALRRIANDGAAPTRGSSGGGPSGHRRATLGLDPSAGDELAFYLTRVAGQQNRCALSLGVILSGDVQRAILVNCQNHRAMRNEVHCSSASGQGNVTLHRFSVTAAHCTSPPSRSCGLCVHFAADTFDVAWMMQYFPQLSTWPRVDMVHGHERGTPLAAMRDQIFSNVMHYSAPLPIMQSVTRRNDRTKIMGSQSFSGLSSCL